MKVALFAVALLVSCVSGWTAEAGQSFEVNQSDSIHSVLTAQVGKIVEVRLASGDKITGKVTVVGANVLHLSQLVGQEFYDAVIDTKAVSAVVVRVRQI